MFNLHTMYSWHRARMFNCIQCIHGIGLECLIYIQCIYVKGLECAVNQGSNPWSGQTFMSGKISVSLTLSLVASN